MRAVVYADKIRSLTSVFFLTLPFQLPKIHRYITGGPQSLVPQSSCDHPCFETDGRTCAEQIPGKTCEVRR